MSDKPSIDSVFCSAIEIESPHERQAFIEHACGQDADLKQQVERLLHAHFHGRSILDAPVQPVGTIDQPVTEAPHDTIGPYKLLEQIGEGGFGVVFMAEQTQPVRRKVALKILKPGMDTRQVVARFEAERQALAIMDHPNIAKVHDGGATPSGRPYFVMELVKGVPITEFCDQNRLMPRQRLELFVPVCQAVQHAHQKGIIHRDLKPSNILVVMHDTKPVPKVIDFGVAKALGQELTDKTVFTGFAQMIGTPLYMSPEQAGQSGLDIDTRSDIYSLGVLLYELLTGTTPFDKQRFKQAAYDEIRRIIREEDPPKPSTRLSESKDSLPSISAQRHTEPAKLTKLVRGELDWIVMKALEKDRSRRYETANGFAMDVQRYLADEAVQACPPSLGYRVRKLARRNKVALAFAGLVVLILLTVMGGIGWNVRDRTARQAAVEQEVNLALKEAERLQEQAKWPEALSAAKRAEGLLAGGGSDELRERVQQLRKDVEMVLRLEEIPLLENRTKESTWDYEFADRAYTKAFVDYGIDVVGLPADEAAARIRARAHVTAALVAAVDDWAHVSSKKGRAGGSALREVAQAADPDPWRRQVRDAAKRRDGKALAALAASPELLRQSPTSLRVLASALHAHGLKEILIDVLRQAQRQYPSDFAINLGLGAALLDMGSASRDEAISFIRAALAVRPQSSAAYNKLGIALLDQKKSDEAIASFKRAIKIAPSFSHAHNNFGMALDDQGKFDEAIAAYRKAIDLDPKYASAYSNLGLSLASLKKLDEAIANHKKAIDLDPRYDGAHINLAAALTEQGELDEAITWLRKAVALEPKKFRPQCAAAHNNLGNAFLHRGNLEAALDYYRKAIELDPKDALAHSNLGNALRSQGKADEAIAAYRKAVELEPKSASAHYALAWELTVCSQPKLRNAKQALVSARLAVQLAPQDGMYWQGLGYAEYRSGNWKAAVRAFEKVKELGSAGDSLEWFPLSMAYWQLGDKETARRTYDQAVQWMEKNNPKDGFLRGLQAEAAELMGIERKKE